VALMGAFLIFFFLDDYEQIGIKDLNKETKSPLKLLMNTLNHIKNKSQLLIIPRKYYGLI
jgi:hypothetical protein